MKDVWPAGGPRVIWKRALGEGYSSPAVEEGVLYSMYGKPRQESCSRRTPRPEHPVGAHLADDVHQRRGR
jgi:hypothetical protein